MSALLILLLAGAAQDRAVHVSPTGDDAAPGTRERPVASLVRARNLARAAGNEAVVILHDGTFRIDRPLELGPEDSGITWKSLEGAAPVISGGRPVTGWKREGDRWVAPVPKGRAFRQIFVDGVRGVRARTPNQGFHRIDAAAADNRTGFTFHEGDLPALARPGDAELLFLHDWCVSRIPVASIDVKTRTLRTVHPVGCSADHYRITHFEKHPRYAVENAVELLDVPGEWFLDTTTWRLSLFAQNDAPPREVIVPSIDRLLIARGAPDRPLRGLRMEGITFAHTDWTIPEMGYAEGQAAMYEDRRPGVNRPPRIPVPPAVTFSFARDVVIDRCRFLHLGGSGLSLATGCRADRVTNCEVGDVAANGIMVGWQDRKDSRGVKEEDRVARDTVIDANRIHHCGAVFQGSVGIWLGITAGSRVTRNDLHDLPYTGISLGWRWNPDPTPARDNLVEKNHIRDIMQVLSDGGGIYTLGRQPGSVLRGNHIHGVRLNAGRAESNGIFMDEGTTDFRVEDNVIYDIARSPIRFHRAGRNEIRNNTLVLTGKVPPFRFNACSKDRMVFEGNRTPAREGWTPPAAGDRDP